jgi:hypothetical protein
VAAITRITRITRITHGNFRLTTRLVDQIERILEINQITAVTKECVEKKGGSGVWRTRVLVPPTATGLTRC